MVITASEFDFAFSYVVLKDCLATANWRSMDSFFCAIERVNAPVYEVNALYLASNAFIIFFASSYAFLFVPIYLPAAIAGAALANVDNIGPADEYNPLKIEEATDPTDFVTGIAAEPILYNVVNIAPPVAIKELYKDVMIAIDDSFNPYTLINDCNVAKPVYPTPTTTAALAKTIAASIDNLTQGSSSQIPPPTSFILLPPFSPGYFICSGTSLPVAILP